MNSMNNNDDSPLFPEPEKDNQETPPEVSQQSRHRHHHRSSSGKRSGSIQSKKKSSFETIVAKQLLKIIGVLFFIGGLLWMVLKSDTIPYVSQLFASFFSVVGEENNIAVISDTGATGILFYLFPGILVLAFAYANKFILKGPNWLTLTSFFTGTGLLYIAHIIQIFYSIFITGALLYSTLTLAVAVTLLIATSVVYFTSLVHKPRVHLVSIAFIYLMVIILAIGYGSTNHQLFAFIFIFSALVFIFSGQYSGSTVNTVNAFFAVGYFGLFFLRKLYIKDNPDLVWFYTGYATVLYLLLMMIRILKPYTGNKPVKRYFNHSIIFVVTVFYFATVWYAFRKYNLENWQWLFALLLTIVNYALLLFSQWVRPKQSRSPYYLAAIMVAAAIIPLMVQQSMLVLYASMASLLFIIYGKYRKNQFAALMSVGALSIAMVLQVVKTVIVFYPAVYFESTLLPMQPFMVNMIGGLGLTLASYLVNRLFTSISFSYSHNWFSRTNTGLYITSLLYASLYFTSFWLFQYLFFSVMNVPEAQLLSWYTFHITFLLVLQLFVLEVKSWVYKPFLWISIASIVAMPLVINFFIILLRELALDNRGAALGSFYFHYVTLFSLVVLFIITTSSINTTYYQFKERNTWILLSRIGFFVYLILAEYDHFSVITSGQLHNGNNITEANRYLPYSLVFFLTSFILIVFSFRRNIQLLRIISLLLLFFTVLKVFIIDFSTFSSARQAFSFWVVGGVLLLYSFFYQQLRKTNFKSTSSASESSSRHHRRKRR